MFFSLAAVNAARLFFAGNVWRAGLGDAELLLQLRISVSQELDPPPELRYLEGRIRRMADDATPDRRWK
jgi:hypothetical protein